MYLLIVLQQIRQRQQIEAYHAYLTSDEGKAAVLELERLRADCDKAEANYLANCAQRDAERAMEGAQ
jgi:hypothetical protein